MGNQQNIFSKIIKSEFYRNIISLFSGMFIARIIPFLFALVIARLYAPETFGSFVLYLTIASVLSILSTGRYESAIILVDTTKEKKQIGSLAQKINSAVNIIALLFVIIFIATTHPNKDQTVQLLLIPFYSFFFSAIQLIRNIYISNKQFKYLSALEIIRALTTGILQCMLFIFPGTGLFLGAAIAQALIFLYYSFKVNEASIFKVGRFTNEELRLAKRYIKFPRFSIASEVLNFLSSQLPILIFKPMFGDKMLGLYSFSHRYISVPVQLLSVSISSVFIQNARSLTEKKKELSEMTFSLFKRQVLLGIVPFAILGFWGKPIFSFIFGVEWEFSGYLAQIISPWLFAVMLGSPLSAMMIVKEKQNVSMWYNILILICRAASLLVGGLIFKDIVITIALYSFVGLVFFIFLTAYNLKLADVSLSKAFIFFLKAAILILPLMAIKIWLWQ
jgi:O-antigen/teichoic acid export membrane protein